MVSRKLHTLFLVTVGLLVLHMIEELIASRTHEFHFIELAQQISPDDTIFGVFVIFVILVWYSLSILVMYTLGGIWQYRAMIWFAFVFALELVHPLFSLQS